MDRKRCFIFEFVVLTDPYSFLNISANQDPVLYLMRIQIQDPGRTVIFVSLIKNELNEIIT